MKIEKWKYKDNEVYVPIFDESEIETNEDISELEKTKDLKEILDNVGKNNE